MSEELNLNAYYYGFNATGARAVDLVLAEVAHAGSSFHSTEDWNDKVGDSTPVGWIQKAAADAAKVQMDLEASLRFARAELVRLQGVVDAVDHSLISDVLRDIDESLAKAEVKS